jgi:hypothetical protein
MDDERGVYSPRLDIAVGPFATDRNCIQEYDHLSNIHRSFLSVLYDYHISNIRDSVDEQSESFDRVMKRKSNARCFLAIEIENKVSNKHLMGGAINAAALGRIGIIIGWDDSVLKKIIRMRNYLRFLSNVGKNSFDTANLLVLNAGQFENILTNQNGNL